MQSSLLASVRKYSAVNLPLSLGMIKVPGCDCVVYQGNDVIR